MKEFEIPTFYRSNLITDVKNLRKQKDPRKKNFEPTELNFGPVSFFLGRHFGFCYGVENAIEIAYRALEENKGREIYMLSQMIHNPVVNADLNDRGISFILDTEGNQITPWDEVSDDAVVIIPAFGTTLEIESYLASRGIETNTYNTTCPFVEKVWKMAGKLGNKDFTIIIHGKFKHEETQATFSHSKAESPSIVVRDIDQARLLAEFMDGTRDLENFDEFFAGRYSDNFDPKIHLQRVGVINQTTMLASDTHEIAEFFKHVMLEKYGEEELKDHFADTRDTLCYATNDNQQSTMGLLECNADLAIVVGGYNSSNTSHIVDLCATKFPTYFINGPEEIKSKDLIHHFDYHGKSFSNTEDWLTDKQPLRIALTSGASCPDRVVDEIMEKLLSYFPDSEEKSVVLNALKSQIGQ